MSEDIEIINQNTTVEKIKIFFANNYKKLIGLFVLILLILFSYFGYKEYKKRVKLKIADVYNEITLEEITIFILTTFCKRFIYPFISNVRSKHVATATNKNIIVFTAKEG